MINEGRIGLAEVDVMIPEEQLKIWQSCEDLQAFEGELAVTEEKNSKGGHGGELGEPSIADAGGREVEGFKMVKVKKLIDEAVANLPISDDGESFELLEGL